MTINLTYLGISSLGFGIAEVSSNFASYNLGRRSITTHILDYAQTLTAACFAVSLLGTGTGVALGATLAIGHAYVKIKLRMAINAMAENPQERITYKHLDERFSFAAGIINAAGCLAAAGSVGFANEDGPLGLIFALGGITYGVAKSMRIVA